MEDIKNGEEKSKENFSKKETETHSTFEMIKDLLLSTTDKVIKDLGYIKNEKIAGVYGDGTTYGAGVEEGQYSIKITSRPRKFNSSLNMDHGYDNGTFEKQIIIGTKRVESHIDFEIKGKILEIQYKSPESGFYRGVDDDGKTFMVREKMTIPLKDCKKDLKELFEDAAKREVGFLTNTKLGVEDRMEKSTTSIVENLDMENLTLKKLFENDLDFSKKETEEIENLSDQEGEEHIPAIKAKNTVELDDSGNTLLFDEENIDIDNLVKELGLEENEEFKSRLKDEYGISDGDVSKLTDVEKKEFFKSLKKETIEEITMSNGGVGAGRYDTKYFAKAFGRKFSKGKSKDKTASPYTEPVNDPIYEEGSLNESKRLKKDVTKTPYFKSQQGKAKVDKNWNVVVEDKLSKAGKPYTQVVKVDPNYHPQGMPFVEPGSKEELENTFNGDKDKMARMGLNENELDKKERLIKRKFASEIDNKKKGINKRYIVTESKTEEFKKNRWKKLATFNKLETIKEAEELNSVFSNVEKFDFDSKNVIKESTKNIIEESSNTNIEEKVIEVEKPGSVFGITQRFYEKDFLNEDKKFILDLNSNTFVKNPNS
jgi:hypothetical protein